jgi:putative transposase
VELANRESRSSWRDFLLGLNARSLYGVEIVVADDHAGLRAALREVLAEAAYQRCYVHFLRNALDYVPRRVDDDCQQELRWLYVRRDLPEARGNLAAWLTKWSGKYPKLTGWVEENIDETLTLTFYRLPRQHHKHLKSTDEVDKRIFCRRSSLSGAGDLVAKSGVLAGSLARPPDQSYLAGLRRSRTHGPVRAGAIGRQTARRLARPVQQSRSLEF